ncbi:response regulator [Kordiimonas lacus]|uniref:Two-component system, chemotaxis family, response regulator CheY n=1 Tax=Kordiimonas lacus TaxID=637679 RepID=A0A1G6YC65_9PROT|nr:response regulator [Kordiimonas lacus]SDD87922.1 two-component system, chemotaxis family, response regulator CheY [Kordiimonas lacus]
MGDIEIRPSGVLRGRTALVVDDQEIIRKMLEKLLLSLGFTEVLQAQDGSDALKMLDRRAFDVIVCDINMDPMGGIDFVRTLRDGANIRFDAKRARTPVLFLTGSAEKDHILSAKGLGVKDYLLKPIDPEKLRARLVKMFS